MGYHLPIINPTSLHFCRSIHAKTHKIPEDIDMALPHLSSFQIDRILNMNGMIIRIIQNYIFVTSYNSSYKIFVSCNLIIKCIFSICLKPNLITRNLLQSSTMPGVWMM